MAPRGPSDEPPIYNRIAVLRAERGISRRDLANALDVHYQTVGYLERGDYHPSLGLAIRLCRFFDLPIEAVFSDRPFEPMSARLYATPAHDQEER
jgi:DNA-binding XRE family transcriptional regulator